MIISVAEHINLTMSEAQTFVSKYTYPIFANALNGRPDLIASCVIIELSNIKYLVTAAHVICELNKINSPLCIAVESEFIEIAYTGWKTVGKDGGDVDIAFVQLPSSFFENRNVFAVNENKLVVGRIFNSPHLSFIHGYPCSKNKQASALKGGYKFNSYAFAYAGKVRKDFIEWLRYGKSESIHICMNYKKSEDLYGEINIPPSPIGISGGGFWLVPDSGNTENIYLAGIAIEYHIKPGVVFATKIEVVVELIKKMV